jgi:hypothetical protein
LKSKKIGYNHGLAQRKCRSLTFSMKNLILFYAKNLTIIFKTDGRPLQTYKVAKKGVVLIEPNDSEIISHTHIGLLLWILGIMRVCGNLVKGILGKEEYDHYGGYEPSGGGNYIYTISEREIEKVALGLNLEVLAFKGLNDCYIEGVEYEKIHRNSALYHKVKTSIEKADKRCTFGIVPYIVSRNHF